MFKTLLLCFFTLAMDNPDGSRVPDTPASASGEDGATQGTGTRGRPRSTET